MKTNGLINNKQILNVKFWIFKEYIIITQKTINIYKMMKYIKHLK